MLKKSISFLLFAAMFTCEGSSASSVESPAAKPHKVLVLGDSLTEGYGVTKEEAYPFLVEKKLKNLGRERTEIINAGISGSTSASGLSRLQWLLKSKPDILILSLGSNDGLRGIKPSETEKNLKAVVELAKKNHLKVLLVGFKMPPNYGKAFTESFEKLFTHLSKTEKIPMIPFLLEGVAGDLSLNQGDGLHPNAKGHEIIARTVLKYLVPLL